jgi:hypothetical protein
MATIFRRRVTRPPLAVAAPPPAPASVLVRPDVLRCISATSRAAAELETGGPLIGTVQRSWEPAGERLIVSVLATVPPGPSLTGRHSSVALGRHADGERAAAALRWLRSVTGIDLVHVGDWHRHPSGCGEPSTGDAVTATRMLAASEAGIWLVAIAVGDERCRDRLDAAGHLARHCSQSDSCQEVRFYREVGRSEPVSVPIRVEQTALPRLPELPWHLADPERFAAECRLLDAAGFKTAIGSADGSRGVMLRLQRNGRPVTVATRPGYPRDAPELVDDRGRRVECRDWSAGRFLVDVVRERFR